MAARPIWLITNDMSGSNDAATLEALREGCETHGLRVAYRTTFPDEELPTPAILDAAGIGLVAIFSGDGTLNAALEALCGWGGEVLVLPGGTMNLLFHRLFGESSWEEVLAAVQDGKTRTRRPAIIRSAAGCAYAGLLSGPGTAWNSVREAMRENNVIEMTEGMITAINETLGGAGVACRDPALGRTEGYPLVLLNPHERGIEAIAFHAETAGEYLDQTWALLRRDFRQGPHETLGVADRVVLGSSDGRPFGLLLDGEPAEAPAELEFVLAACDIDLLATRHDG